MEFYSLTVQFDYFKKLTRVFSVVIPTNHTGSKAIHAIELTTITNYIVLDKDVLVPLNAITICVLYVFK